MECPTNLAPELLVGLTQFVPRSKVGCDSFILTSWQLTKNAHRLPYTLNVILGTKATHYMYHTN